MTKQTIWFIINPISGGKNKKHIPSIIEKYLDKAKYEAQILTTQSAVHTLQLAKEAVAQKVAVLVAVGGDGTINNIAQFTAFSETKLGIIPLGSGNGFARELKLYGSVKKAIQYINQGKTKRLDSGKMNHEFFINLCGIGFDAHVGSLFAGSSKRGLQTYLQIIWRELIHFKAQAVEITTETESINASIFMASICNGPQFGNNAFIAPNAQLDDALFDMTLIHEFPKWKTPFIAACILFRKIHWVKEIRRMKATSVYIKRAKAGFVNIDGEPVWMEANINITMNHHSINVIVP